MLSVPLTAEIQQRLGELAKSRGQSDAEFARELIEASIEELDDVQMATSRLEARQPALTSDQARKALGLDDRVRRQGRQRSEQAEPFRPA